MPVDPYDTNLQGLWLLTEASGTRYDQTANNNDLTDYNTVTSSTDTKRGALSAQFTAANTEYLEITDAAQTGLAITGNITLACWVKPATWVASQVLLEKYKAATNERGYMLWLYYDLAFDTIIPQLNLSGNGTSYTIVKGDYMAGGWNHVVATYDGSYMRIYQNGVLDSTPEAYSAGIYDGTAPFRIGAHVDNSWPLDALMSEAAIWSRALSATEIWQIYTHSILRHRRD